MAESVEQHKLKLLSLAIDELLQLQTQMTNSKREREAS